MLTDHLMKIKNMQIERPQAPITGYTPFALGFRPFFWSAGIFALLALPFWLTLLWQGEPVSAYYLNDIGWHRHEMLHGYTMAVIAGFLLTAVKNWTNQQTPSGYPLALLFSLWLAARVTPLIDTPALLIAALDMLFAPAVAIVIAIPIWRSKQLNNQVFPAILLLIAMANLTIHLELLGITQQGMEVASQLSPLLMLWILVIMAGRVVPFFIERATQGFERRNWRVIELLSSTSLVILMVALLIGSSKLISLAAIFAAIVHFIRLMGWYTHQLWKEPLIWVLWLGYLWLIIGFLLHALAEQGLIDMAAALHAYFVGALGVLSLGMMARVAIGHSGREMRLPHRAMVYAFVLINLAALTRIAAPLLPFEYLSSLSLAATFWCLSFAIFSWLYSPILLKARIDGRPG